MCSTFCSETQINAKQSDAIRLMKLKKNRAPRIFVLYYWFGSPLPIYHTKTYRKESAETSKRVFLEDGDDLIYW